MLSLSGGIQYVVLGTGERKYHDLFTDLAERFPRSFAIKIAYNNELAHLIEAGADMYLMPSRYEPCGLNQLYSLRYGTVPIVRGVGGLEDTIVDYTTLPDEGTGFKFHEYSKTALLDAVEQAILLYRKNHVWSHLMKRGMETDFSWEQSARQYIALYAKAVGKHEAS
jgi:starch synthase